MLRQAKAKVPSMAGKDAVISAAILLDKEMLLRGEGPGGTGPTVHVNVNPRSITLTAADSRASSATRPGSA